MKKMTAIISTVLIMAVLLSTSAVAAVVFLAGDLRVENTESWQYIYDGYIQTNLRVLYQSNRADRGYIRYMGGASGDTGRLYTPYSRGQTVSKSYRYVDTLNPFAPQTEFYYGFEWTPGSPSDVI